MNSLLSSSLQVLAIPIFQDNYVWLIHNHHFAIVIDPGEANAVIDILKKHHLQLSAIFLTHHHDDHIGGVNQLCQIYTVPVYGIKDARIPYTTHFLTDQEQCYISKLSLEFTVFHTPGHTLNHIVFYCPSQNWLFCGDTLFGAGCGRLFEGTPAQMQHSLSRLCTLPDETQIFCAHEYTLRNLEFALLMEPKNPDILIRLQKETQKIHHHQPTLPSTLLIEKQTNPFLRCSSQALIQTLIQTRRIKEDATSEKIFQAVRAWKDNF
jgi:hydroxyacylglutathione hydrolase